MKFMRIAGAASLVLALAACTAEQTEEGEMPEVNVEGGNMPEYDVDPARVNVGTDTSKVITPDIDVTTQPASTN